MVDDAVNLSSGGVDGRSGQCQGESTEIRTQGKSVNCTIESSWIDDVVRRPELDDAGEENGSTDIGPAELYNKSM